MQRPLVALALFLLLAAGCGKSGKTSGPTLGVQGKQAGAGSALGFPAFATKNTTRVGGGDPVADAAGVAQAVYSARSLITRPTAVTLVDKNDWRAGIAASLLMSAPLRAPILFSDGTKLPAATSDALAALQPRGAKQAGGAQVIRVGNVARPKGLKTTDVEGKDPESLAAAVDRLQSSVVQRTSDRVMVVSEDAPEYAMPAAAWAAKSGDPVLFVKRDTIPSATQAALTTHQQPRIYVIGPTPVIGAKVEDQLRKLGTVTRVQGPDPVRNAIAFARFIDGPFGWGVVDPGHGLVFASQGRPNDAAAAAPLSASGTYGPLLLVDQPGSVPRPLMEYLLDVQPGFSSDPVRGVYNHGWLIGDTSAISVDAQSQLDALLEIVPVSQSRQ